MARRYINTSKFNPYTYQELAAPLERATALLSQQAQNLSNVEMQNLALGKYLDPETDAEEIQIYENNMKNLRGASDHLMKYGLRGDIYNVMKNANVAYFTDIQPMQNAISNRLQFYSKRNEFLSANPDVVVKGPLKHSLKEFYNGIPQLDIISGKAIQNDVAAVMGAISKGLASIDKVGVYDKYNDKVLSITGYGIDRYQKELNDPNSLMQKVMHDVMQKHGAEDVNRTPLVSNEDYNKLWNYAQTGSYNAIGQSKMELQDSGYAKDQQIALGWAQENRLNRAQKFNEDMQIIQLAAALNMNPQDVADGLKNGTLTFPSSSNNNTDNMFNKDGTLNTAELKVHLKNGPIISSKPVAGDGKAIGIGNVTFELATVQATAEALKDVIDGKSNEISFKGKRSYLKQIAKDTDVDLNNLSAKDIQVLYQRALNDYKKLDYVSNVAIGNVLHKNNMTWQLGYLDGKIKDANGDIIHIGTKAESLHYENDPNDPTLIHIYKDGEDAGVVDYRDVVTDPSSDIDMTALDLIKNLNTDYKKLISDPKTSWTKTHEAQRNFSLVSFEVMDSFIDHMNTMYVYESQSTNVNVKDDNSLWQ